MNIVLVNANTIKPPLSPIGLLYIAAYLKSKGLHVHIVDIGIEKDNRKENAITHKIDPAIDGERDFIAATLQQEGLVLATGYLDRPKQVKETKTATGGSIKTDGRTLVIVLKP